MKPFKFDVDYVREQFPALCKTVNGRPAVFADGPGGTQVPVRVVEKINDYLYYRNANSHGVFKTSVESDGLYWHAREVYADFFNCSPEEVAFGANTSTNNFKLALGLVRTMSPGDEVLITDIDHEGNRSPWRTLADFGIVVKSAAVNPETATLDMDDFKAKLGPRTKVVAVNWAANACGTITDVKECIRMAHEVGAITVIDAVHYAPHRYIDVKDIDTDVLLCSSYKFFGPHLGVMYVKKGVGDKIKTVRVMADDNCDMPWKLETGTPAMELACGAAEAVEFIADLGARHAEFFEEELKGLTGRRRNVVAGMLAIDAVEEPQAKKIRTELAAIPGLKIFGPPEKHPRTSTVSFLVDGINANDIAKSMAEDGIFVWDGDYYAIEIIMNVWKLGDVGGLVRIGLAPYNTDEEIDRIIQSVRDAVAKLRK